ncbi:MAG: TatD family hydrolase, partial [bacterium]|nr:TatD family hydrolase [bacterium]
IHCRDLPAEASAKEGAYEDLIRVIEEENFHGTGEIHSFTGTWEQAKAFLNLGFFVALNGIITFDKTGRSEEVVKNLPLERIILETDSPYLTPVPHRGKRNEPSYVKHVAQKIAEWKNIHLEEVERVTTQNAINLFRLGL